MGYSPYQFKEIGEYVSRVDLGVISISAYAPRWFMMDVHINPEEVVQIHLDIHARQSLVIQWGTFPVNSEPRAEPQEQLTKALLQRNIDREFISTIKTSETRSIRLGTAQQ